MTLIAFATYGADRAEFITDTASYTQRLSHMGHTTKYLAISHLDAAVLSQGDLAFGKHAKTGLLDITDAASTFDDLVDVAPEVLTMLWDALREQRVIHDQAEATVFLLGYSPRAEKFTAWGFAHEDGFLPFKLPGLFIMPTPWTMRPHPLILDRLKRDMAGHPDVDKAASLWAEKPPRPAPRSPQEWIDLALDAREQRSLSGGFGCVAVAGDLFHTRLKRGSIETRKVHTFNDTGDEFLRMVEFTQHPVALAGPCWCESGKTYGDCHALGQACECRSSKTFGECCGSQPSASYVAS